MYQRFLCTIFFVIVSKRLKCFRTKNRIAFVVAFSFPLRLISSYECLKKETLITAFLFSDAWYGFCCRCILESDLSVIVTWIHNWKIGKKKFFTEMSSNRGKRLNQPNEVTMLHNFFHYISYPLSIFLHQRLTILNLNFVCK